VRYDYYTCSLDPSLRLGAEFHVPDVPRPLCLFFHGWHMTAEQSRKAGAISPLLPEFFVVNVDMRGRGGSSGVPDASGFELIDGLDALEHARRTWPHLVEDTAGPFAVGGSGGGGNVLALVGKAPDTFAAAVSWAGMSDYALWYREDSAGVYRDEMDVWIGGPPDENPEGYLSRGGLHVLDNLLTPLLLVHGRNDVAVPVRHTEEYVRRSRSLGKAQVKVHYNDSGHDSAEWPLMLEHLRTHRRPPEIPRRGRFLVHGFLACRPFRLILEDPSRMGRIEYRLDDSRRLIELHFVQQAGAAATECATLILDTDANRAMFTDAKGNCGEVLPESTPRGHIFRLTCRAPWSLKIGRKG